MNDLTERPWLSSSQACTLLGISNYSLARLVERGLIGTICAPGMARKKYSRADVERVARQSTRPATVGAEMAAHS